jgi:hypothetical protein
MFCFFNSNKNKQLIKRVVSLSLFRFFSFDSHLFLKHDHVIFNNNRILTNALLKSLNHIFVFLRSLLQNSLLLSLHSLNGDKNMGRHILDLPLLFESINYVWNLLSYGKYTLTIFVKLIYYFFTVAKFSCSLIYKLLLSVLLRCLPSCFNLLVQLFSSVLKEQDLGFVEELQLLSHILYLFGYRGVFVVRWFPVSGKVLY